MFIPQSITTKTSLVENDDSAISLQTMMRRFINWGSSDGFRFLSYRAWIKTRLIRVRVGDASEPTSIAKFSEFHQDSAPTWVHVKYCNAWSFRRVMVLDLKPFLDIIIFGQQRRTLLAALVATLFVNSIIASAVLHLNFYAKLSLALHILPSTLSPDLGCGRTDGSPRSFFALPNLDRNPVALLPPTLAKRLGLNLDSNHTKILSCSNQRHSSWMSVWSFDQLNSKRFALSKAGTRLQRQSGPRGVIFGKVGAINWKKLSRVSLIEITTSQTTKFFIIWQLPPAEPRQGGAHVAE